MTKVVSSRHKMSLVGLSYYTLLLLLLPSPHILSHGSTTPKKRFSFPNPFRQHSPTPPSRPSQLRITKLTYPNGTILPSNVIFNAATRSELLSNAVNPPPPEKTVPIFASLLRTWYRRQGYVLHGVTGVTIQPEDEAAVVKLYEPVCSDPAIRFRIVKRDDPPQETTTAVTRGENGTSVTLTDVPGRTRASPKWEKGLGLIPRKDFCWSEEKWRRCAVNSGIFKKVWEAKPVTLEDGTVQLSVIAEEGPARSLEYGVVKSLYTGAWEGELDFQHSNLFGSGESLGLSVIRGTKEPEPSIRLHYQDPNFGSPGAYDITVANDYMGSSSGSTQLRRGGTVRLLHLPVFGRSTAEFQAERVTSSSLVGGVETVVAASFKAGPVARFHSHGARDSRRVTVDVGLRTGDDNDTTNLVSEGEEGRYKRGLYTTTTAGIVPFVGVAGEVRRVVPLRRIGGQRWGQRRKPIINWRLDDTSNTIQDPPSNQSPSPDNNQDDKTTDNPVEVAWEGVAGRGWQRPNYRDRAVGVSVGVRGYDARGNGALKGYIGGKMELRVPLSLSKLPQRFRGRIQNKDVSLVAFGDWLVGDMSSPPMPLSSSADGKNKQRWGNLSFARKSRGGGDNTNHTSDPTNNLTNNQQQQQDNALDERDLGQFLGNSQSLFRKGSLGVGLRATLQGIPVKYDFCVTQEGKMGHFFGLGKDFDV